MSAIEPTGVRGSPLIMLVVLLAAWTGGRALTWENPYADSIADMPIPFAIFAEAGSDPASTKNILRDELRTGRPGASSSKWLAAQTGQGLVRPTSMRERGQAFANDDTRQSRRPELAFAHNLLWLRALGAKPAPGDPFAAPEAAFQDASRGRYFSPVATLRKAEPENPDRWSFDGWGFWRQGSNATAISQGRVPIYGASQVGARLQYRLAPSSQRDPQAYLRAYRAMVRHGENEGALGVSARPVGALPVRLAAELRVTDTRFGTDLRPAIMATTELPAQQLPARFRLEVYGGAGYVGGKGATAFADGQLALTREVFGVGGAGDAGARLSLGAGAWGGVQKDAHRVDVGPTMRVDVNLGKVPARLSVDWRERVGGDAAPGSGLAATLSTRF